MKLESECIEDQLPNTLMDFRRRTSGWRHYATLAVQMRVRFSHQLALQPIEINLVIYRTLREQK